MHTNPYTQEKALNGAKHYLMGRGAAGIAGFISIILLVRYMDVHNYAAYTALTGLAALCCVLASLGMERVVSRYIPEGRLYHSVTELSRFIWFTSAIRLLAGLVVMLVLYVSWPVVDRFLTVSEFKFFSIALACLIVAEVMFQHFSTVLQSLVMQKTLTRLLIIQWSGRLMLIAAFVWMKSVITWEDALWIFAIPEMLGIIGFVVVIKRHLLGLSDPDNSGVAGENWPNWEKATEVGLHNYGFTLLAAPPQGYFMKLLTAAYLPVEIVAAYGFFISVAEKIRQYIPLHFFYGLLEPMIIASYLKDRDFSVLSQRCQLLYKSNLLLLVPAIAWVAVAGDPIVAVMTGGKFQGLSWILILVMIQLTIGSHVVLLQLILNSLEKSKLLITASMVALPVLLLAMAVAINTSPIWLLSAPILFSLAMNLYIVFQLAIANHCYKLSWKMLGGVTLSGLLSYLSVGYVVNEMSWYFSSLFMAMFPLFAVIAIYTLSLWAMRTISWQEMLIVKSLIVREKIEQK
ncbi:lipopolysaccharide biosynthesis protein [Methylotenera sp.]|uniref:lipopolysaccharide biosynthesis protein n=1 Tax=Methylotenera sp. TaxID=2051956 RepID=UPI002715BE54|nr:oligosaccharide flippase family protein [Methylotenera sp.]MDO9204589.1 oligosaccharide flippase family protein [Methylotenera sp.]MDP2071281.1 oligosaccharide flippase family protein [Methylotenera sp.]MDP3005198.1 oligosaccharide flippase family protein [Methylotenera sp.]